MIITTLVFFSVFHFIYVHKLLFLIKYPTYKQGILSNKFIKIKKYAVAKLITLCPTKASPSNKFSIGGKVMKNLDL